MPLPKTAQSYIFYTEKTVTPGQIALGGCLDVNVSATKAQPTHFFQVQIPALHSAIGIVDAKCLSAGVVIVRLMNPTGSAITPAAGTWKILAR